MKITGITQYIPSYTKKCILYETVVKGKIKTDIKDKIEKERRSWVCCELMLRSHLYNQITCNLRKINLFT